jgi:hypothetical protein
VKQQLPSISHDRHDPMLIVRLYDGDVDAAERDRATALIADCRACAELYADLGAISSATRRAPTPPRPRDFTLTEADAARLSRRRSRLGWLRWPGLRRSFGGALTALGLVGVLLAGTTTSPAATSRLSANDALAQGAADAPTSAPAAPSSVPSSVFAANGSTPAPVALGSGGGAVVDAGSTPGTDKSAPSPPPNQIPGPGSTAASQSAAPQLAGAGTPPPAEALRSPAGDTSTTAGGDTSSSGGGRSPSAGSSPNPVDGRSLELIGFGLAFLLGLGLLAGPRMSKLALRRLGR